MGKCVCAGAGRAATDQLAAVEEFYSGAQGFTQMGVAGYQFRQVAGLCVRSTELDAGPPGSQG
ncbi:hypothetical protein GCM10011591_38080 [Nocardia camponoti]|uniref:Uncharacterized protein n=1 Tax=Nocardia camponoti TaxID=1616106 RepID=A0A917VCA8_9NOCA|nr:hypothetical protein GCM10011591_38080 [Nocardia camponoti]